ncbi:MAG TPA: helix-turn-helix transcriptional regulator [Vineibacter sp.]|nr:helix-turn-helix transcriptional regulator [Vineibacter sp.]
MNVIRPIAETTDSVTLRRADFERLVDLADAAHSRAIEKAAKRGETEYLPVDMVKRLARGESPVRLWRERRGLTQRALAERADVSVTYLSEIESGRKPGSVTALSALARALGVSVDDLVGAR